MTPQPKAYQMQGTPLQPVLLYSIAQQAKLGALLGEAISQGRSIELRQAGKAIQVLLSPADDLGKVIMIGPRGRVQQIGITEEAA